MNYINILRKWAPCSVLYMSVHIFYNLIMIDDYNAEYSNQIGSKFV